MFAVDVPSKKKTAAMRNANEYIVKSFVVAYNVRCMIPSTDFGLQSSLCDQHGFGASLACLIKDWDSPVFVDHPLEVGWVWPLYLALNVTTAAQYADVLLFRRIW